jgi:hypothetical protein
MTERIMSSFDVAGLEKFYGEASEALSDERDGYR